jgi:hypothetical protein
MNLREKKMLATMIMFIIIFIVGTIASYPYVIANAGEGAFSEPDGIQSVSTSVSIKTLIIQGAGYFLTGNSEYHQFLNRVETAADPSNLDYDELNNILDRAIDAMASSLTTYGNLVNKANATPYNNDFIEKLVQFDYKRFRLERNLTGSPIDSLEDMLEEGDVRGVFTRLRTGAANILAVLNRVKSFIDARRFPVLYDLWRLNQSFSETMLFGQYAAEIFYSVSGIE